MRISLLKQKKQKLVSGNLATAAASSGLLLLIWSQTKQLSSSGSASNYLLREKRVLGTISAKYATLLNLLMWLHSSCLGIQSWLIYRLTNNFQLTERVFLNAYVNPVLYIISISGNLANTTLLTKWIDVIMGKLDQKERNAFWHASSRVTRKTKQEVIWTLVHSPKSFQFAVTILCIKHLVRWDRWHNIKSTFSMIMS